MEDIKKARQIMRRLLEARSNILRKYPFFGNMLMRLKLGVDKCETAYTDMEHIVFDPAFADVLSDRELEFVMNHEVMHCALHHCTRGKTLHQELFNIACDIVVNSIILEQMGLNSITINGIDAMHLTPDGREGRKFSAEEVYQMLIQKQQAKGMPLLSGSAMGVAMQGKNGQSGENSDGEDAEDEDPEKSQEGSKSKNRESKNDKSKNIRSQDDEYKTIDSHGEWHKIKDADRMDSQWDKNIIDSAGSMMVTAGTYTSQTLRDIIDEIKHKALLNWREILQDFVQLSYDQWDYTFAPPDNRFTESDFALPAFHESPTETVTNLWFLVDTSGSINKLSLSKVIYEIKGALDQFPDMTCKVSFFDTVVSEPVEIDSVDGVRDLKPVGGGGTSFHCIFNYLDREIKEEEYPTAIIIMTDGYAIFPKEKMSKGIPVLWIIQGTTVEPPWGKCVYLN